MHINNNILSQSSPTSKKPDSGTTDAMNGLKVGRDSLTNLWDNDKDERFNKL